MRLIKTLSILIGLVALASFANVQIPDQVMAERQKGADILKKLAETNYEDLGFGSAKESREIEIESPIREFMVRLDELKEYKTSSDPLKLLKGGDEYTFPVKVGKEVKSSFTVAKVDDKWMPVSFGSPNRTKLIMTVLSESISDMRPAASFFLVKVPSLYYYFLAYQEEGKLFLIPLLTDTSLDFSVGKPLPAEKVFNALAPIALKYPVTERTPGKIQPSDIK